MKLLVPSFLFSLGSFLLHFPRKLPSFLSLETSFSSLGSFPPLFPGKLLFSHPLEASFLAFFGNFFPHLTRKLPSSLSLEASFLPYWPPSLSWKLPSLPPFEPPSFLPGSLHAPLLDMFLLSSLSWVSSLELSLSWDISFSWVLSWVLSLW